MDIDELPRKKSDLIQQLCSEDLDPFSIEALEERTALLQSEIKRIEAAIKGKTGSRSEAEALFGNKAEN